VRVTIKGTDNDVPIRNNVTVLGEGNMTLLSVNGF